MSRIRKNHSNMIRIGKIKVGAKTMSRSGKEIPCSLDYFRATGDYAQKFHTAYGEKPKQLLIGFFSGKAEDNCIERYEIRQGKKLFGFSMNDNFYIYNPDRDTHVPEFVEEDKQDMFMSMVADKCGGKWEEVLYLNFFLPEINALGYWQFSSKGKASSIRHIIGSYDMAEKILSNNKDENRRSVKGVRFLLSVEKVTSSKPGSQTRFPVVSLIPEDAVFAKMLKDVLKVNDKPDIAGEDVKQIEGA